MHINEISGMSISIVNVNDFYLSYLKFAFGNNILMNVYECIYRWQIFPYLLYIFILHIYKYLHVFI